MKIMKNGKIHVCLSPASSEILWKALNHRFHKKKDAPDFEVALIQELMVLIFKEVRDSHPGSPKLKLTYSQLFFLFDPQTVCTIEEETNYFIRAEIELDEFLRVHQPLFLIKKQQLHG